MRLFLLCILVVFGFESVGLSCLSETGRKSASKKHGAQKKVSQSKASKKKSHAANAQKNSQKLAKHQAKSAKKSVIVALPKKKQIAQHKARKPHRDIASVNSDASAKSDPIEPMLAYLNNDESSTEPDNDKLNAGEIESQAIIEVEDGGTTTIRKDRAKITAEDPMPKEGL